MSGNRPVFAGGNPGREGKHHRLYGWVRRSTCTLVCLAAAGALTLTAAAGPGEPAKSLSSQTPAVTSHPDQQAAGGVIPGSPNRSAAPSAVRTAGTRAGSPIFLVMAADGTPSFDADDQAGNDRSADNGIVRVNDKVIYKVQYQYNNLQNQDVSYVLKLPKGLMMDDVPTSCAAGSTLTPKSAGQPSLPYRSDSLDDLEAQTLTCLMGRKTGSSTEARTVEVKVSNAVPNGRVLTPESLELKVGNVPGTSAGARDYAADSLPPVTVSSRLKWDLAMQWPVIPDYTWGPRLRKCSWDESRTCQYIEYPLMIQADADGKGAMPVVGPVSITDDLSPDGLFPQLTDEQRNRMKTDPDKYGARVSVDPGKFHVSHMPLPSFGFYDPPQPDKSVRDSGVFTAVQPAGPGTPATITIEKTDWSLLTNPKYSETGSPLPEHMAYVVSMCVNVDIPIDTVTDFGTQAAGAATWSLDMHNRYTQMEMRGLDAGSDHATIDSQPTANDSLDRTLRRDIPGGLTVGMGGMPGDARNTPGEKFHKGWANSIPGLPGDAVYRMAENTVMRGQKVTAQLMYGGANSSTPTTVTHLSCAVWDPAQYYLTEVDTPGADPGSWYDRPSGGRPVWLSGASPGMATRPIQVWYAGNAEAGAGTPDRNRLSDADCSGVNWVDSPDKVQGNDPALAAQGIYTAVNRVRIFAPIPPPQGIADTVYESVLVGLTVSSQKVPDGSILDFWSSDRQKYTDSSLAEMLETPLPSASGFIADHWGWATLARAHARIGQLVSPASDDSNRVKTLKVTGNDLVHFHITPTLTSPGGPDETTNEVWIEDCLPAGLEYDPAGTTPTDNLTTYPQSPPDAKRACGAGETYMRWIFPGQKVNEPIAGGIIVVQARVSPAAKNDYYANNAYIWASGDRTTDKDLLSSYSLVVIDNPAGVFLDKLNVTPQVQVNRSGSLLTQSNVWRVRLGSTLETQETRLTDPEIIDVLPGRAGDTASHFSGKAVLKSVKVTQGAENGRTVTVEYTKADKVPRTPDWSVPVTWCATLGGTGCPASLDEVTAIRLVRPGILVNGEAIDALISVDLIGDKGGDVVTNTAYGRVGGLGNPVGPVSRTQNVVSSSIGDKVWWDVNGDGIQDEGEPPAVEVAVRLTGLDDLGNQVDTLAVTKADGTYDFPELRSSSTAGYTLTFDSTVTAAASFSPKNRGNDRSKDSDVDRKGLVETILPIHTRLTGLAAGLQTGSLAWTKKSAEGSASLKGSRWKITDSSGRPVYSQDGKRMEDICDAESSASTCPLDMDPAPAAFLVQKLRAGEYLLVETKAPAGFGLLDPIPFTIDRDHPDINLGSLSDPLRDGPALPLTGGGSRTTCLLVGLALLVLAAGVTVTRWGPQGFSRLMEGRILRPSAGPGPSGSRYA